METKINSILIPTDFSELSESAVKVGIAIAKRQNADVTLLHVADRFSYLQPTEVFIPDVVIAPDYIFSIEERIKQFANKISYKSGIKVTGKVLTGQPFDRICRYAFEEKNSLIVMGTHGTSGLREFFIGSEAFRVVKSAPCPVLIVPGNWGKYYFEKVLFPVRLVPGLIEKYFYTRPIIEKNCAELLLLGLTDKKSPQQVKELALLVDKFKIQLNNDNIKFQIQIQPSNSFPSAVIETAKNSEVDLIVITGDLEFNLKSYFVGPYTQQIVNHAKIPVLSIKLENKNSNVHSIIDLLENWERSINSSELNLNNG